MNKWNIFCALFIFGICHQTLVLAGSGCSSEKGKKVQAQQREQTIERQKHHNKQDVRSHEIRVVEAVYDNQTPATSRTPSVSLVAMY